MSWLTTTLIIVAATFVGSFLLVEWIVARPQRPGGDDSATG
jgi:hypothetical protein